MFLKKSSKFLRARKIFLSRKSDQFQNTKIINQHFNKLRQNKDNMNSDEDIEVVSSNGGQEDATSQSFFMTPGEIEDYDQLKAKRSDNVRLTTMEVDRMERYAFKLAMMNKDKESKNKDKQIQQLEDKLVEKERQIADIQDGSVRSKSTQSSKDRHTINVLQAYFNTFDAKHDNHGKKYMQHDREMREAMKNNDGGQLQRQLQEEWDENSDGIMDLAVLLDLLITDMNKIEVNYQRLVNKEDMKPKVISCRHVILRLKEVYKNLKGQEYQDHIAHCFVEESEADKDDMDNRSHWELTLRNELNQNEQRDYRFLKDKYSNSGKLSEDEWKRIDVYTMIISRKEKDDQIKKLQDTLKLHKKQINNMVHGLYDIEHERTDQMVHKNATNVNPARHPHPDLDEVNEEKVNMKVYEELRAMKRQGKLSEREKYKLMVMELQLKLDLEQRSNKLLRERDKQWMNQQERPISHQQPHVPQPGTQQPTAPNLSPQQQMSWDYPSYLHPQQQQQPLHTSTLPNLQPLLQQLPIESQQHQQQQFQQHPQHQLQQPQVQPSKQIPPSAKLSLRDATALGIPKFSGGKTWPKEWPSYWRTFNSIVHTQDFSEEIKLQMLCKSLTGKAADVVAVAGTEMMPYAKAIERLKKKYNDETKIRQFFLEELKNIKQPLENSIEQQKSYYEDMEKIRAVLQDSGMSDAGMRLTLIQNMMHNLSSNIHTEILKHHKKKALDEIPLQDIFDVWEQELTYLDRGIPEEMLQRQQPHQHPQGELSFTGLVGTRSGPREYPPKKPFCVFCPDEADHYSQGCPNVTAWQERYNIVKASFRCLRCLSRHHLTKNCPSQRTCFICNENSHHTALHDHGKDPQNQRGNFGPNQQPQQQGPRQQNQQNGNRGQNGPNRGGNQNGPPGNGGRTMAIAPITDKKVLLNIIQAKVTNPETGEKIMINCLFDNCCQMSSVRTDIFKKLALPNMGIQGENVSSYGGKPPEHHSHIQTRVPIETEEGIVNVDCWAIDCIVTDLDTRAWKEAKSIFPEIDFPQLDQLEGIYRVDLLIGQDFGPLFSKCVLIERQGMLADKTTLGWVLSGKLPTMVDEESQQTAMMVQLNQTMTAPIVCQEPEELHSEQTADKQNTSPQDSKEPQASPQLDEVDTTEQPIGPKKPKEKAQDKGAAVVVEIDDNDVLLDEPKKSKEKAQDKGDEVVVEIDDNDILLDEDTDDDDGNKSDWDGLTDDLVFDNDNNTKELERPEKDEESTESEQVNNPNASTKSKQLERKKVVTISPEWLPKTAEHEWKKNQHKFSTYKSLQMKEIRPTMTEKVVMTSMTTKPEGSLSEGEFLSILDSDLFKEELNDMLHSQVENLLDPTEFDIDSNKTKSEMLESFAKNLKWRNGRYEVRLNWRKDHPPLNSNYNLAKSFLEHGTRKMLKDGTYNTYKGIIDRNVEKGIFKKCIHNISEGHYIPHFGVPQPRSTTTPLRMVISCATGHPSINECLLPGGNLLNDLPSLIRMIRTYPIAFTGDISQAYNSVALNEDDLIWTKFLWWENGIPFGQLASYLHLCLNFGFVDAFWNYMATVITHLEQHENPFGKEISPKMYSDNYMDGAYSREEALRKIQQAIKIFADGGFILRKFTSSDPEIRQILRENNLLDSAEEPSLLGYIWSLKDDLLMYKIPDEQTGKISKRSVLKYSASWFDPCGFLSGISVNSVNFLAQLWDQKYSWDEEIRPEHQEVWRQIKSDYKTASKIRIPRLHEYDPSKPVKLHIITDSSKKAQAANAYLIQGDKSTLVTAKFKLPAKKIRNTITVPEGELSAMALGAQIAEKLTKTYKKIYPLLEVFMWTDSTIALSQLHSKEKHKIFVMNRINKIRTLIPNVPWRHLSSQDNAADLISRGMTGDAYLNSDLYWHGPELLKHEDKYPEPYVHKDPGMTMLIGTTTPETSLFKIMPPSNYPTLKRYRNVLFQVLKYINKIRKMEIAPADLQRKVEIMMVKTEQQETLSKEFEYLKTKVGPRPSLIHPNKLFLDEDDIIRHGGRMHKAQIGAYAKFPIFLTKDSPLIDLRVMDAHTGTYHGGQELTKTKMRHLFWVQSITTKVKKVIKTCYACKRASGKPFKKPTVPALPEHRLIFKPYEICGIDATGHVWLKNDTTGIKEKYWIIIITCANIRHVNLELVKDLTTQSVLDALKLHSSVYGASKIIMADNAQYFKSTEKVLELELGKQGIKFKYSPVKAPWYGSIWERLISVFKGLIRRTIQRRLLSAREFSILLKETGQIINNRPLTVCSNDIRDDLPLTPNKLLFGRPLFPLSQGRHDESEVDISYNPDDQEVMKHWRLHDSILREFKERFFTEYLAVLRQRHVYDHTQGPLQEADIGVGDLVLIKGDEHQHRMLWQMAEVTELMPGIDQQVRAVRLRTVNGTTTRPICLLYPLLKNHDLHPQDENTNGAEVQVEEAEGQADQEEVEPTGELGPEGRPRRVAAIQAELNIQAMQEHI